MKKLFIILSAVVLGFVLLLTSIFFGFLYFQQESVIASLPDYESKEFYTNEDAFQDYTDYAKYIYDNITIQDLEYSGYFTITTADNVNEILLLINDFEGWAEACGGELKENYDFDKSIVSEGDFFYIKTKEGEPIGQRTYRKFENYDVYYFDVDAQILYYFHNNI